ncbi:hypothetical protein P9112_002232 [Eukaryota sp. TZLM1-RC]
MPVIHNPFKSTLVAIADFLSHASELLLVPASLHSSTSFSLESSLSELHTSFSEDVHQHQSSQQSISVPGTLTQDWHVLYSLCTPNASKLTPVTMFTFSFSPSSLVFSDANVNKENRTSYIHSLSKLTTLLRSLPIIFNTLPVSSLSEHSFRQLHVSSNYPTKLPDVHSFSSSSTLSFYSPRSQVTSVITLCGCLSLTISFSDPLPPALVSLPTPVLDNYLSPTTLDTSIPPRRHSLTPSRSMPLSSPRTRNRSDSTGSLGSVSSDYSGKTVPPDLLTEMKVRVFPNVEGAGWNRKVSRVPNVSSRTVELSVVPAGKEVPFSSKFKLFLDSLCDFELDLFENVDRLDVVKLLDNL